MAKRLLKPGWIASVGRSERNISYLIPCRRVRWDEPFPTSLSGFSRCLPNRRVIKEIM